MTVRVLALTSVNPNDTESLSIYMATTSPLMERANAKILTSYAIAETIVGDAMPATVTIVEYPDMNAVQSVFQSSEYGLLKEIRAKAFTTYRIGVLDT
jgi:uncharacterized protein (DUF1330 family)